MCVREAEREVNLSVESERGGQQVVGFSPLSSSSTSPIHPLLSKFFSFTPSQRPHLPLLSLSPSPFPHHFSLFTQRIKKVLSSVTVSSLIFFFLPSVFLFILFALSQNMQNGGVRKGDYVSVGFNRALLKRGIKMGSETQWQSAPHV